MRSGRWKVIALLLALAMVAMACTGAQVTDTTEGEGEATTSAAEDQPATTGASEEPVGDLAEEVIIVQGSEPNSLAPDVDAIRTTVRVWDHVFEAATKYVWDGENIELVPWLTESWEQIDEFTWRFHVREGITFHNGEPLTAEAWEFTVNTYVENQAMLSTIFNDRTIEVVDDLTFDVVTNVADFAPLPATMSFLYVYPPGYYEAVGMETFGNEPVGTGPYEFVQWDKGVEIRLQANDDYWTEPQPTIQQLVFQAVPEGSTRAALLETGEAHLVTDLSPELGDRVDSADNAHVVSMPSNRRMFLFFNTTTPPTDDVRVRQAVNFALDTESIRNDLFQGFAGEFNGVYLPGEMGYDPEFDPYGHNVESARELLAEAGFPDGLEIDLHYPIGNYTLDAAVNEAIAGQLAEAGITARLDGKPISELSQEYANQDSTGMNWFTFAPVWFDPSFVGLIHFRTDGLYRYNGTAEQDALLLEAQSEQDPEVREQLYKDLQEFLILERAVWAPLYAHTDIYGVADSLSAWDQNARPDQLLDMQKVVP